MKPILIAATIVLGALAGPALAGNGGCPPGLAKKSPACVPPGQAKKHHYGPRLGERVDGYDYHVIRYPDRYDLPPARQGEGYYIVDGRIVRVDRDTLRILDFIRAASALLD